MFKPLLKSIPSLSGNMKIVCNLEGYEIDSSNRFMYNCNVNNAYLTSISSNLYDKNIPLNLKNNSFEYDVKQFYLYYANVFYKNNFNYSKVNIPIIDFTSPINNSNTDFKYGCKRVSYLKSGNTLAFYSPIYIESEEDIKGKYFVITCIFNKVYQLKKQIKIKISNINEGNNLADYLVRYASKLDDKVINCSSSYKNIYYGISLKKGGFVKIEDNISSNLYNKYYTINDFDATLNNGFKRNYIMMKQVIPLSFYFDPDNLLNDFEKKIYNNAEVIIQGRWYDVNNNEIPFYDFSDDYSKFEEDIYNLYYEDKFRYVNTEKNIMDLKYPACNEASSENYKYVNTISKNYNRWKLKYSDDIYPYIINNNYAFSLNQGSLYAYKEFPIMYSPIRAYANLVSNTEYNLIFDFNDVYSDNNYTIINNKLQYFNLYNKNFISNFFDLFNDDLFKKEEVWSNVNKDGKVYHKGILYDLNSIYNENLSMNFKIDKFGVFVKPNFSYTLAYDFNDIYKKSKNIFTYDFTNEYKYYNLDNIYNYYQLSTKSSYIFNNSIVTKDINGLYVDLSDINVFGTDYQQYEKGNNNYIDVNDIYIINLLMNNKKIDLNNPIIVDNKEITLNLIDGYKVIDIYNAKNIYNQYFEDIKNIYHQDCFNLLSSKMIFRDSKYIENESIYWAKDKLFFSIYPNKTKFSLINNYSLLENISDNIVLYYKTQFVRYDDDLDKYLTTLGIQNGVRIVKNGTNNIDSPLDYHKYYYSNGIYDEKKKILYTDPVFRQLNKITNNYGIYNNNGNDKNFIYVDPYNLKNIYKYYLNKTFNIEEYDKTLFYCNFLNMDHIRLYFKKLYKDENLESNEENIIENIYIKVRNFNNIVIDLDDDINTNFSTISIQDDYVPIYDFNIKSLLDINYYINYDNNLNCFYFNEEYFNKYVKGYNDIIDNGHTINEDMLEIPDIADYVKAYWIFDKYNIKYFEICFKKEMILLNDDLYKLIINRTNDEIFKDLYLYHIENPKDYKCPLNYCDDELNNLFLNNKLMNNADNGDYIKAFELTIDNDNEYYLHFNISDYLINLLGNFSLQDLIYTNNITSCLSPYFNAIYDEHKVETKIYSDYFINNIIRSDGKYRYNEPSLNFLTYIPKDAIVEQILDNNLLYELNLIEDEEERERQLITASQEKLMDYRYTLINDINDTFVTSSEFITYNVCQNIENINEYSNLITYNYNGTYYGFYIINSYFDNTNNTLNIQNKNLDYINCVDYINGIHVSYISDINNTSYLEKIYKNILPYINTSNPVKFIISNTNTLLKPKMYKLKNNIKQYPNIDGDFSYSYTLYNTKKDSYIELLRYFDDIVPYIPEVNYINSYYLYYKETNKMIENNLQIKRNQFIMYQDHVNLSKFSYISYFDNNCNIKKYEPTEYKYYNYNRFFNLEKEIKIKISREFNEDEIIEFENNNDNIFELFVNYINNTHFDTLSYRDRINNYLFLYKKYKVKFIKDFKYINSSNNKVYSLTIKFSLL